MNEDTPSTIDDPSNSSNGSKEQRQAAGELPTGNHALEVAARNGIGPLSPKGREIWHGEAKPCVSCGQLIPRSVAECVFCGQDHGRPMLEKMRQHAGPWYVLEHIRPFPGVSLERIVMQIRRGLITESSIIRGPSTNHQWRFAVEAPGLCLYFERCWSCHGRVTQTHGTCPGCRANLGFEAPPPIPTRIPATQRAATDIEPLQLEPLAKPPAPVVKSPLDGLSAAVAHANSNSAENLWDSPPRLGGVRVIWFVAAALITVMLLLVWVTQLRNTSPQAGASQTTSVQPWGT